MSKELWGSIESTLSYECPTTGKFIEEPVDESNKFERIYKGLLIGYDIEVFCEACEEYHVLRID